MQPTNIKQHFLTNRKDLVDTLYLMMLQGINQLLYFCDAVSHDKTRCHRLWLCWICSVCYTIPNYHC